MTPSPQQADIATLKYHSPCGNMYTGSGDCENMHVKIFNQIENKHLDCVTVECRQSIRSYSGTGGGRLRRGVSVF